MFLTLSRLTLKDIDVKGKRVFIRVDFNVPLSNGRVMDDSKILAALPTLRHLLDSGARVVLASHLGRPKGKVVDALRMDPVAQRLSELLGQDVGKADQITGELVEQKIDRLSPGSILVLENVRFDPGEEKNDPEFAASMARMADLFVNDAFGTVHRAHASNSGIATYLPAVAGLLMEREMSYLNRSKENPSRPLVAILGGRKVADKIGVIRHFLGQVDYLLLGGAMANTFLKAEGCALGNSLYEPDKVHVASDLLQEARKKRAEIILPVDVVIVEKLEAGAPYRVTGVNDIPEGWSAVDIGPETVKRFQNIIKGAKMVLWNGPLGAYEFPPFNRGTEQIARALAEADAETIVGGGDIVAALEKLGLANQMTHLSTGGGAVLDFWEGKSLPGLEAIAKAQNAKISH